MLYDLNIDNNEQVVRILESIYIRDEISRCEDIDELKDKIFPMIRSQQEQWMRKISAIIQESGYKKSKFADKCGVSRVTVDLYYNYGNFIL